GQANDRSLAAAGRTEEEPRHTVPDDARRMEEESTALCCFPRHGHAQEVLDRSLGRFDRRVAEVDLSLPSLDLEPSGECIGPDMEATSVRARLESVDGRAA